MMKKTMRDRRRFLWMAPLVAFLGVGAFIRVSTKPRFQTIHVLDVIDLMSAGAALAGTIFLLVMFFVRGPQIEHTKVEEKSGEESN